MIIQRLKIYGYGKWSDQQFELDESIQVIMGPNEAGKSTIVDFIKSILFGFPTAKQATHGQFIPKDGSKFGGELFFREAGHDYRIVRTKGTHGGKVSFYDLTADIELTKADFEELLSPITRQVYDNLFYFGEYVQKELYGLNKDKLRSRIQQIGVAGSDQLIDINEDFEKQAEHFFAKRGTKRVINKKLTEYDKLSARVEEAKSNFSEYELLTRQVTDLNSVNSEKRASLKEKQSKLSMLQSQASLVPLLSELNSIPEISEHQLKQGFSEKDHNQVNEYLAEKNSLSKEVDRVKKQIDDPKMTVSLSPAASFYRQNLDKIDSLYNQTTDVQEQISQLNYSQQMIENNQGKINSLKQSNNLTDPLPKPFDDQTKANVANWLKRESQIEAAQASVPDVKTSMTINPVMMGISVIILVVGLLMSSIAVKIGGIVVAAAISYFFGINRQASQDIPDYTEELADLEKKLTRVRQTHNLNQIDSADWLNIQPALYQITELNKEIAESSTVVEQLKSSVNDYFMQWDFANDWLAGFSNGDANIKLNTIRDSVTRWRQDSNHSLNTESQVNTLKGVLTNNQENLEQVEQKLAKILSTRHMNNAADFETEYTRQQQLTKQFNRRQQLVDQIEASKVQVDLNTDLTEIQQSIDSLKVKINSLRNDLSQGETQATESETKLAHLIRDGEYHELQQQQANLQAEILEDVHTYVSLLMGSEFISKVLDLASKGRLPKVINQATDYFGILTNHHYDKLNFDAELTVTANDGMIFAINELSRGTLEQLYLSLVLAMAVNFADEYQMPIIIDDGFVNFDVNRRNNAYELLNQVAKHTQVIYLTANQYSDNLELPVINL